VQLFSITNVVFITINTHINIQYCYHRCYHYHWYCNNALFSEGPDMTLSQNNIYSNDNNYTFPVRRLGVSQNAHPKS
jgi:hypothetical protein